MFRRFAFISLAFAALLAATVASIREFALAARYNVVVLTVESTRFDALSPDLTPAVWQAARSGTRFLHHRTASAWTGANIVSILTGLSAFHHGIHTRDVSIPADWDLPLKRLATAGWRVEGLQPFMLIDEFRNIGLTVSPGTAPTAWLATQAHAGRPFFLWYHYLETHLPYEPGPTLPPPENAAMAARRTAVEQQPAIPRDSVHFAPGDLEWIAPLYRAQFQVFDNWFREFWTLFNATGLRNNTILVLTTDHGEELLERGMVGHASTTRAGHLHDEITHVPLIVWLPPGLLPSSPPATVEATSSHLDIMPTLFARILPESPMTFEGRDLFSLPPNRPWNAVTSRAGFAEPDPSHMRHFIATRVEDHWKLQVEFDRPAAITRKTLYDMARDPGERTDLSEKQPDRAASMLAALMPDILALRVSRPARSDVGTDATMPEWIYPPGNASVSFDELPSPLVLRWSGDKDGEYRLQYRAGEGALALEGELAVAGLSYDFGPLSRDYWDRYIVPYRVFHFRLGPAGRDDVWTPWVTIRIKEG
jgi:choline-sulfatase